MRATERGQATPVMAVALVVAALVAIALVRYGTVAIDRAKARTAADAAALAGAADGEQAAATVAKANQARVVSYRADGDTVIVSVRCGRATASARARFSWPESRIGGQSRTLSDDGP